MVKAQHLRAVAVTGESPRRAGVHSASAPGATAEPEAQARAAVERGDHRRAVDLLIELYGTELYRYIRTMMNDDALADDVWQTVFIQAYRDLEGFAGRSSLRTWLYGIARHRCLDALKAHKRHRQRFSLDEEALNEADAAPLADQRLSNQELLQTLEQCLQKLPPHIRMVMLLRYREGFSFDQIAKICQERPATVRARVSRALPVLRACIERTGPL